MKFKLIQPDLFDSENNTISKYHIYHTRISGRYAPFILAPAEGSVARTQGLASLADWYQLCKKIAALCPSSAYRSYNKIK